jgi:hypothetical protein
MKVRTYGLVSWSPKYLPDTMVEAEGIMVRYGDLDQKFEWTEVTVYSDKHPVFVKGMHWADEEV